MAFITRDFVKESSTTTGTGAIVLAGARAPGQRFATVCANGDTLHYAISHDTLNQWEVGIGTYNSGADSITRTTTIDGSSGLGVAVNFSAGTKNVDLVEPAARIVNQVGPVQIGATSFGSGTLSFAGTGISFSLSTNTAGGTVHASVNAGAVGFQVVSLSDISSATRTQMTALFTDSSLSATRLVFPILTGASTSLVSANVLFRLSSNVLVAGAHFRAIAQGSAIDIQNFSFQNANAVSFGLTTTTNAGDAGPIAVFSAVAPRLRQVALFTPSNAQLHSFTSGTDSTISNSSAFTFVFPALPTSSSLIFSSNNMFYRLSTGAGNNSILGAAHQNYIAGTDTFGAQHLSFSNLNGVTFGIATTTSASFGRIAIISASVAGGGGGITAFALSNAASSVMATGLTFSNANGFSFLLSTGASVGTLSGSYTVPAVVNSGLLSVSAGASSANVSSLVFSNLNGVTFGLSTAASAATLTASVAAAGGGFTYSGFHPHYEGIAEAQQITQHTTNAATFTVYHVSPPSFQCDRIVVPVVFSLTTSTHSGTYRFSLGIYTRNGASLSLVTGTTFSQAVTVSTGNATLFNAGRLWTIPFTTTLGSSNYWLAVGMASSTAGANASASLLRASRLGSSVNGIFGVASNVTAQSALGLGMFTQTVTSSVPANIAFAAITGNQSSVMRPPMIYFGSSTQ